MNYWLIKSFLYAWQGIKYCLNHEKNLRLEFFIAIIISSAGFYFHLSPQEWITVLLCQALVLSLEMMNTSIEKLSNMITQEIHPVIKQIKDMAAGAVLLSSIVSCIIGLIIFIPKIKLLFIK
jgi:undecaprenol kinase